MIKTVEDIRNELAAIASELRVHDTSSATQLDTLNSTVYATTTEYLVETLTLLGELKARATVSASSVAERLRAVELSARRLARLR